MAKSPLASVQSRPSTVNPSGAKAVTSTPWAGSLVGPVTVPEIELMAG